jgi:ribosomal protein S18 acetylase RimI-like enzyme
MRIRHATPSDFQHIAAIHIESWKDSYADVLPARFLAEQINRALTTYWNEIKIHEEDIVLVSEEDLLVGFIAVWCRPIPFIDNLHVRPSHRSKRLGTALLKSAAKKLIRKGHKTAYLWVFENNKKAIKFYQRLGGVQQEQAGKNIFGYEIPSRKMVWNDLSVINKNK